MKVYKVLLIIVVCLTTNIFSQWPQFAPHKIASGGGDDKINIISVDNSRAYDSSEANFTLAPFIIFEDMGVGFINPVREGSVSWGDYDNDNDLDILLTGNTNFTQGVAKIFRNDGNNFFNWDSSIPLNGVSSSYVAWGDYNNDNNLDMLITGRQGDLEIISKIYRNNGDTTFTEQTDINLTPVWRGSAAWFDYNNDGKSDILITGRESSDQDISKVYRNYGNNNFIEQTDISLAGVERSSVDCGDYDNDGDMDILLSGYYSTAAVYRNDGDHFNIAVSFVDLGRSAAAWGDYNCDGYLDILLTGHISGGEGFSRVYKNLGDGSFSEQTDINLAQVKNGSVDWGDYNNDGYLDILLSGMIQAGNIVTNIYKNIGGTTFEEQDSIIIADVYHSSVRWGDYDNDGDLDIVVTGRHGGDGLTKVYRNNLNNSNLSPSVPQNLQTVIDGNAVELRWDKSTDQETPQDGLTYNIYVGTSLGSVDIVSPLADINTRYKKTVSIGNTNHNNSWTIKDLAQGTYYWSVQAVDNSFACSKFANQDSFIVSVIPVELTAFTASTSNGRVTLNWATATETNNQMFEIERRIEDGQFATIGYVEGHGTTTEIQNYQFSDNISDLQATAISYRLKQIDYDGSYEYSDVVEVTNLAPTDYALHQNYPNPFNPVTTISYSLPVKSQVELVIYNTLGESVTQLVNEEKEPGRYEVKFSAQSAAGGLPSGIYFYRLQAGDFIQTKKMILMK